MKANIAGLKAMCKAVGLAVGGKKQELIDRLVSFQTQKNTIGNNLSNATASKSEATVVTKPKKKRSPNRMPSIPISSIQIKKNEHGNYEHPETKLIFDRESKQVIGKQQQDGTISKLTEQDIQQCDQFKFTYIMPETISNQDVEQMVSKKDNQESDEIVETLDDIIAQDDEDFEEFYESDNSE